MQHSFNFQLPRPARFLCAAAITVFLTGNILLVSGAADKPAADKPAADKPAADKPAADKPAADKPKDDAAASTDDKKRIESTQASLTSSEKNLKRAMAGFGVEDEAVQDSIIAHVKEEVWAHAKIREQVGHLYYALRNKKTSDKTLKALTSELNAAIAADQKRRAEADKRLDRKVKYSENPRMEAVLLMFGIIGDGPMMTDINPARRSDRSEKPEKKD